MRFKKVVIFWIRLKQRNRRFETEKVNAEFSFIETLANLAVTAILVSQARAACIQYDSEG